MSRCYNHLKLEGLGPPEQKMTAQQFANRREKLLESMRERGLDALLVSALPNVRYLTGFTGSNAMLLLGSRDPLLFTDPRYEIQAPAQTDCPVRIATGALTKTVGASLRRRRFRTLGFEADRLHYSTYETLLSEASPKLEFVPASGLIEELRMIKDAQEIDLIRRSVELCSKAHARTVRRIRPGMREFELAAAIDHEMRKLGAEKPSFETIVAFGERTALPHATPTGRTLKPNELILMDVGAMRSGYASDMTRMAFAGRPARKVRTLHQAVLEAQLAAVDAIRPGIAAAAVDRKARQVLKRHGLEKLFVHSTGHGLGLEIHEAPRIGRQSKLRLERGMVITVEPGVYMEGFGGIRIEDTVVVTDSGCEVLTPTSKELLEL